MLKKGEITQQQHGKNNRIHRFKCPAVSLPILAMLKITRSSRGKVICRSRSNV